MHNLFTMNALQPDTLSNTMNQKDFPAKYPRGGRGVPEKGTRANHGVEARKGIPVAIARN
jgi:hypothetical protein